MDSHKLNETAKAMMSGDKGLLAMDESTPTANKRFAAAGIPQNEESRRAYRDMIVTTRGLGDCLNGAILVDETIRQQTRSGTPFAKALERQGIIPGIKVDAGANPMAAHPGEKLTSGLDGLRERLAEYAQMGARFAKWRAVITIGDGIPSRGCLEANALLLALYAALCQEAGIVPIVEPEVLMDGNHALERCAEVTERTLHTVFEHLVAQRIYLEGMILKPNMIVPGKEAKRQNTDEEIADATIHTLLRTVPAAVPGVAFLSGGQTGEQACSRLNAMNSRFRGRLPWALTYSFARAIQSPAMDIWHGEDANVPAAQKALLHRATVRPRRPTWRVLRRNGKALGEPWMTGKSFIQQFRIAPGQRVRLKDFDPAYTGKYDKKDAGKKLEDLRNKMSDLQQRLFAERKRSLLICLQALDAGGKDGVIKHVIGCMNPDGCRVANFKEPTQQELAHDFLWRVEAQTPAKGEVAIFNRSHYEDVLIVRIHNLVPKSMWSRRYAQINDFERRLVANGTHLLKFFLHISKKEQLQRFEQRLDDPAKRWKISEADYTEREHWDDYLRAYEDALARCNTADAPWFVIPADHKWFRDLAISEIIVSTMQAMDFQLPQPTVDIEEIRRKYHSAVKGDRKSPKRRH